MKRREFLKTALIGGLTPFAFANNIEIKGNMNLEYYELRKYYLLNRTKQKLLDDYLSNVAIPAMNRIGIGPVGVFNVVYGPDSSTIYVLLVYKSLELFASATSRLLTDAKYQKSGESFINAPISEPLYLRMENSLMVAFERMPKLKVPESTEKKEPRIFELRTYESHSIKAGKKKIEMFNEGGEIDIFRKTGLQPVFFGETLIGQRLPNLNYMLAFSNMTARDKQWEVFRSDSDWKKLSTDTKYADTVSNITDIILQPTPYSQI